MRKLLLIGGLILWSGTALRAQQVKGPVPKRMAPKTRQSPSPEPPLVTPKPEAAESDKFDRPWHNKRGVHDSSGRGFLIKGLTDATFQPGRVFLAAHRAQQDAGTEPENSMEAVRALFNPLTIIDIVELDIKRSKDDSIYIMHDIYLQRTTDFLDKFPGIGTGRDGYGHYRNYTWAQVKTLTLKRANFLYTNRTVPLFREVLRYIKFETPCLINLDIRDTITFRAVWNIVKQEDAFDVCIFKSEQLTPAVYRDYYGGLTGTQKTKVMFFPIIPPTPPGGITARAFYDAWETTGLAKGYELGYRQNMNGDQERQLLDIVDAIHQKNRVRVHVFNSSPFVYSGRYLGSQNINQCCNDSYDSRGNWEYLFDPRPGTKGANGYVITDDPIMLKEYLGQ